jgi:hypothetical protein
MHEGIVARQQSGVRPMSPDLSNAQIPPSGWLTYCEWARNSAQAEFLKVPQKKDQASLSDKQESSPNDGRH